MNDHMRALGDAFDRRSAFDIGPLTPGDLVTIGCSDRRQSIAGVTTAAEIQQRTFVGRCVTVGVTDLSHREWSESALVITNRPFGIQCTGGERETCQQSETEFG